jgi:drug/metabolite transporter (DMT)-like permease
LSDRPAHWHLYSLVALVTLLWSANFVFAKFALREFPALLLSGVRTLLAGILMVPVYVWHSRQVPVRITPADARPLLTLGLLGIGLNQVFFVLGLSRTSASHAAFIIGLTPLLVLALAVAVGQEKLNPGRAGGMLLALGGVLVLRLAPDGQRQASLAGDVLVFLGSLSFSAFTVLGKQETSRVSPVALNTCAYLGSAVALLPVTLWEGANFPFQRVTWTAWSSLLYMAGISSVLAYLIYYRALAHISASRVSAFSYLQPLIVTLLAVTILGERPTQELIAGGALVLAGVLLAERA